MPGWIEPPSDEPEGGNPTYEDMSCVRADLRAVAQYTTSVK
jgi:hypothetical protein